MTRNQFKAIQNIAAKAITKDQGEPSGRTAAKSWFGTRGEFVRQAGAFIHRPTATLFVL